MRITRGVCAVFIRNDQDKLYISQLMRNLMREAVRYTLLSEECTDRLCEVSLSVVDDKKIRALNMEYRGIDRPTDVLSFPLDEFDEQESDERRALGDIVVSAERAEAQAKEYGHSVERELAFLCVHSTLHLIGYDHETGPEAERDMFERQDSIMNALAESGIKLKRLLRRA